MVGALGRPLGACGLPRLVVAPVAQERLVECGGIAVLGVLDAKEMPLVADLAHRLGGDLVGAGGPDHRVHVALDLLQHLAIHDEFLGAGDQPALQPAGGVIDHVRARLHRRPQAVGGFPHRLCVGHVGRADARGAQRQFVKAGKLTRHLGGAHVFGRAECRRPRFHIDVRGECADGAGRAGADHLRQHHRAQRLGQALSHRAGHRHRRHGTGQRERRHHQPLPPPRQPHPAVQHRIVVLERRGRVDVGEHVRAGLERFVRQPGTDAHHLHHVLDPLGAQRIGMGDLVGQRQLVIKHVQVPHRGVDVLRFNRIAADEMDAVEILAELQQGAAHLAVAGNLAPQFHVPVSGGRRDVAEIQVPPTHGDLAVGVAWRDGPAFGRVGDRLHHEIAAHAHALAVDVAAAGGLECLDRLGVQKGDPDLFEDAHRAIMNRGDAFGVQRLDRGVDVDRRVPGHLLDRRGAAPGGISRTAAAAPSAFGFVCHRYLRHALDAMQALCAGRGLPVCDACCR